MPVFTAIGVSIATGLAATGLAVGVGGAVMQYDATRKAGHAEEQQAGYQREARAEQQKIQENTNRQQRIGSIRRARQASAQVRQQAVNIGAATSTSASASAANPFTRAAANEGFQNEQLGFMRTRNSFLSMATDAGNRAVGFGNRAAMGGAISGAGSQVMAAGGGFKQLFQAGTPSVSAGQAWANKSIT